MRRNVEKLVVINVFSSLHSIHKGQVHPLARSNTKQALSDHLWNQIELAVLLPILALVRDARPP